MVRATLTLVLVVAAFCVALTPRGLAVLGVMRPLLIAALGIMGVLQVHRLLRIRQARQKDELLNRIPKRPLGI